MKNYDKLRAAWEGFKVLYEYDDGDILFGVLVSKKPPHEYVYIHRYFKRTDTWKKTKVNLITQEEFEEAV